MSHPESWDAKDFIFSGKYYCPICATPEDGKCQVLDDWEIEKWGSCKVLKDQGIYTGRLPERLVLSAIIFFEFSDQLAVFFSCD